MRSTLISLKELGPSRTEVNITDVAGKDKTVVLHTTAQKVYDWFDPNKESPLVQVMFPELPDGQREVLLTGFTDNEWDAMFEED